MNDRQLQTLIGYIDAAIEAKMAENSAGPHVRDAKDNLDAKKHELYMEFYQAPPQ